MFIKSSMCHPDKNSFQICKQRINVSLSELLNHNVKAGHSILIKVQNHKSNNPRRSNNISIAC